MFTVGDIVIIKDDFEKHRFDDDPSIDPHMSKYAGTVTEIKRIQTTNPNWYKLENNCYIWDERWLEPYGTEFKPVTENEVLDLFGE